MVSTTTSTTSDIRPKIQAEDPCEEAKTSNHCHFQAEKPSGRVSINTKFSPNGSKASSKHAQISSNEQPHRSKWAEFDDFIAVNWTPPKQFIPWQPDRQAEEMYEAVLKDTAIEHPAISWGASNPPHVAIPLPLRERSQVKREHHEIIVISSSPNIKLEDTGASGAPIMICSSPTNSQQRTTPTSFTSLPRISQQTGDPSTRTIDSASYPNTSKHHTPAGGITLPSPLSSHHTYPDDEPPLGWVLRVPDGNGFRYEDFSNLPAAAQGEIEATYAQIPDTARGTKEDTKQKKKNIHQDFIKSWNWEANARKRFCVNSAVNKRGYMVPCPEGIVCGTCARVSRICLCIVLACLVPLEHPPAGLTWRDARYWF
ncbi:hypothetical protein DE146DRAFT_774928 [Phaeosphaeria sp. MPI-PUGE-AT-0046c]|nr:hypothetical protein DE146DRAFT_774928 [Phaeosphaeria sp. MPI-PUGE-AT-0046c]